MHELLDVKSCLEGAHGRVLVVKHSVAHDGIERGELWLTIPCLPYQQARAHLNFRTHRYDHGL